MALLDRINQQAAENLVLGTNYSYGCRFIKWKSKCRKKRNRNFSTYITP
jgi:hypothetical protein